MSSPRRPLSVSVSSALGAIALLLTTACTTGDRQRAVSKPVSFAAYQQETMLMLQQKRAFQGVDVASEITWNAPQEWRPAGPPEKGILLVHGLGDSPWSFQDLGVQLAAQGFLVRTILLPGHGTRPEDMLDITLEDWQKVVTEQTQLLRQEVDSVYLGGFSTGANLVLDYAYAHPDITGLLLMSPAFKSNSAYDWLTPLISWARPWLRAPDNIRPMQNSVRYMTVPTNGFAQFYRSSKLARHALRQAYEKPVLMVVAEHDSVLDTAYLREVFTSSFTHPASRMIWYGTSPNVQDVDARILTRTDNLPDLRISQFSHMGILFSPHNNLYGAQGSLRICWNGQTGTAIADCEHGVPVWYSDWGYNEPGKFHARLTFNPYFDWQSEIMAEVFSGSPSHISNAPSIMPRHAVY